MLKDRDGNGGTRDDRVNLKSSQFRGELGKSDRFLLGKPPLDLDALALDVAKIFKPLAKRVAGRCLGVGSEVADSWDFLRLSCRDRAECEGEKETDNRCPYYVSMRGSIFGWRGGRKITAE